MARAVDLIEDDPGRQWLVTELAQECAVSVRALQDGFVRQVGVPPGRYLRRARLRRVRSDLMAADSRERSVSEVASRWGFLHLGRFAALYSEAYGELPSQTLHRH